MIPTYHGVHGDGLKRFVLVLTSCRLNDLVVQILLGVNHLLSPCPSGLARSRGLAQHPHRSRARRPGGTQHGLTACNERRGREHWQGNVQAMQVESGNEERRRGGRRG